MEQDYSKRELDDHFGHMNSRFDRQDKQLADIKEQTIKTNGRVSKLEGWQSFIKGGMAVITILLVPLLFMMIELYLKNIKP